MSKYEIIIYWSNEDESFIAEVPELPGCMADGSTYQEALANAEVVIEEWIVANGVVTVRGEVVAVQVPESMVEELVKGKKS